MFFEFSVYAQNELTTSYPDSNHHDKDKVDDNHSNVSSLQTYPCTPWSFSGEPRGAAVCIFSTEEEFQYNSII